jgi:hypothetical protein
MNKISGVFISFSDSEMSELYDFLEANKYSRDNEGLKEFIFDCVAGGETQEKNPVADVLSAIQDNPILVQSALGLARKIFSRK